MNETIRCILERRTIREGLTGQPLRRPEVEAIVSAGLAAPSSKNARPWRFVVVDSRQVLSQLADAVCSADSIDEYVPHDPLTGRPHPAYVSTVLESAEVLRSASVAIFVFNQGHFSRSRTVLGSVEPERLRATLFGFALEMLGVGAAVQNMMLAAHSLGLGAAFMGDVVVAEAAISARLRTEDDLVGVVTLGPRDGTAPPPRPEMHRDAHVTWSIGG